MLLSKYLFKCYYINKIIQIFKNKSQEINYKIILIINF